MDGRVLPSFDYTGVKYVGIRWNSLRPCLSGEALSKIKDILQKWMLGNGTGGCVEPRGVVRMCVAT